MLRQIKISGNDAIILWSHSTRKINVIISYTRARVRALIRVRNMAKSTAHSIIILSFWNIEHKLRFWDTVKLLSTLWFLLETSTPYFHKSVLYDRQYISNAIDANSQLDVIYTDFTKAFDRFDHGILLSKLNAIRFSTKLLGFFIILIK